MAERKTNKLVNNWKVVLLSFLGATTFWFFNALNKDYSALISYPVEFDFQTDSIVVLDPLPENVRVDVSSGGWNLFRRTLWFSVTPIRISLDNPTDIKFLTRSSLLPIVTDHLNELQVNYLLTDTLFINVERKISRRVNIRVDSAAISIRNNHEITSPVSIEPDQVTIYGPVSLVNNLEEEYYVMIPQNRINDDISTQIDIPLPYPDLMESIPPRVNVSFSVDRFENDRIRIPVEMLNFPEDNGLQLEDTILTVSYIIRRDLKEEFNVSDFGVTVDYKMMNSDDSTIVPIIIYYPEVISEVTLIPDTLQLIVR
jgi:hypothetical protein